VRAGDKKRGSACVANKSGRSARYQLLGIGRRNSQPKDEAPRTRRGGAMDSPIHIIKHCFKHRASKYYQYMGKRVVRDNPWLWQKQLKSRVQNKLRAAVSDESNTAARSFSRIDR